ncbi:helix-turn-helix transcriptional regulator [Motiliproteus sp. SC1-56]|uniref:helix-turn-helix transcriptional regulator n=1 Tax=Motiliproteus sp. SC1-56 TaxID=2799565 RepID=UPI001A8FB578|nr:helix-turn-helix transcriptional regulator [Motiliproteus sp. SC1-56]
MTQKESALTIATAEDSQHALDAYINQIAKLVRGMRAQRGMTRKVLSQHSGISERYLAQVELGKANMSVSLLWRLAEAMNVGINDILPYDCRTCIEHDPLQQLLRGLNPEQERRAYDLLRQEFAGEPAANGAQACRAVALIGLRGAGKSALGRLLAEKYGVPFVRLGAVIETLGGLDMQELLTLHGQKAYRKLERQAIDYVLENYERVVLEIGGSLVSERETYDYLRRRFFTVWLRALPEEHMSRVMAQGDLRPMAASQKAMDDLKLILSEREPFYSEAHAQVDTSGRALEACAEELIEKCAARL